MTARDDAAPPLAHTWAERWLASLKVTTCSVCGAVKRRDDKNPACRGPVRIDLRRTR